MKKQQHINPYKALTISLGAIILIVIVPNAMLSSSVPIISTSNIREYHGNELTLTGSVIADCYCIVKAKMGDAELKLDEQGQFVHTVSLAESEKESALSITAEASPRFWIGSAKKAEAKITAQPQETPIEFVDAPKEWKGKEITFTIKLLSGSSIDLRGGLAIILDSEEYPFKAEWSNVSGSKDMKLVTLKGAFDSAYNSEFENFKFTVKAKGYKTHEETIKVSNQNYDAKRVAADKEASQREMKLLTMEQYNLGDDIQIAVSRNIPKSRTVGYRYVLNPDTSHFIRILVSVKNASLGEIHVNPNYITLRDSTGYTYNPDEATYGLNYLDAIDLQPGGATSGWLAFIVPKDEKELTLIYSSFDGTITKKIYVP